MKIIQLTPYFYPHMGGVESHVLELSKHLQDRGHEVEVLTTQLAGTSAEDTVEGVKVKRREPMTIQFSTPVVPQIRDVLLEEDYDILHTHSPPPIMSYFGVRTAEKRDIPSVLTYHCDLEIPNIFGPLIVDLYYGTLGTYTVNLADEVIATSDSYGATSQAIWDRDTHVIPNAVDAERFHPDNDGTQVRKKYGIKPHENMVLYVGRLVKHKGLEYLVKSANHTGKDTRYIIVGTGDHRSRLEEIVNKNTLQHKVTFAGRISNELLPKFYAAADIFVLPSVSRLEAFGIVALEAMASGVPVVVSDIPGVREVITEGENGLLAQPMSSEDIAGMVRAILRHPDLAEEMGKSGRKRVLENFTWAKVAEDIEGVYEQTL